MIRLKSLLLESTEEIFGLGTVSPVGVVYFKRFSPEWLANKTHSSSELPLYRDRFRYDDGWVEWTGSPTKESRIAVENYLAKNKLPFERHSSYFGIDIDSDSGTAPAFDLEETYTDSMSDNEKNDLSMDYFDVGQDEDEKHKNYCWIWDGIKIIAKKGGSHGYNFGHHISDKTFKGWYDTEKNMISIVFPDYELRKLDRRPTADDIPEQVYKKLISTFGKRTPTFVVFESVNKSQLKRLIKEVIILLTESGMRGEWWFQDGQAVYADGDVGDMNHEMYVIDTLRRQVLDALGIDTGNYDNVPDIADSRIRDEIFESIKDELTPQEIEDWIENNDYNEVIISYLTRMGNKNISEILYYIRGHDKNGKTLDPRDYALVHWGWQRVVGNTIQTQTLTTQDLSRIVSGLYEAYSEELEENNPENITDDNPMGEPTFDIEVMSTRSWYQGIPISVLEKKNPTALNPYRSRY